MRACRWWLSIVSGVVLTASVPRVAIGEDRVTEDRVTEGRVMRDSVPDSALVIVSLDPMSEKPLRELLREEIVRARALGRTPFLELGATWCEPCQALQTLLDAKPTDSLVRREFAGTYLIRLDVDQWKSEFDSVGIPITSGIPAFFVLDTTGYATATFSGANVRAMTPDGLRPVQAFFHAHLWKRRIVPSRPPTPTAQGQRTPVPRACVQGAVSPLPQ
jgi:hypothetical protein